MNQHRASLLVTVGSVLVFVLAVLAAGVLAVKAFEAFR